MKGVVGRACYIILAQAVRAPARLKFSLATVIGNVKEM
jgi:hypothetical protein